LPNEWAGAEYYWEKVADRNVWDFALVSIAAAMKVSGGTIQDARLAAGAVECVPRRLQAVENALRGQQRSDDLAERVPSRGAA
jgi:xanthine dehydrogenase YagS FAD-binding subunit